MRHERVSHVGVVIPCHNEELLLGRCLRSIHQTTQILRHLGHTVRTVVVADDCTDQTTQIAVSCGADVIEISARNVGAARAAGAEHLLAVWSGTQRNRIWLAHTDADSVVPRSWLTRQVALANAGHEAVIGTIRLDARGARDWLRIRWATDYSDGGIQHHLGGHGHVHGANLGVRADAYVAVDGFRLLRVHEDRTLVQALCAGPWRVAWDDSNPVTTSDRTDGRAEGGFATYLRQLDSLR